MKKYIMAAVVLAIILALVILTLLVGVAVVAALAGLAALSFPLALLLVPFVRMAARRHGAKLEKAIKDFGV